MGCVAYADDIAIMTPSLHGLKVMIEICEEYAVEYDIKFNGQKSQWLYQRCHSFEKVLIC